MTAFGLFGLLLALIAAGRLLGARKLLPENAADSLNVVALYVCMPASILLHAPSLVLERDLVGLVVVPWGLLVVSVAVLVPLCRVLRFDRAVRACLLTEVPMGNTAYLGYSLVPTLAGAGALKYAVVYDQFGTFLILTLYGLFVVATHSGGSRPTVLVVVKRVLLFPPFIALIVGLTLMPASPPEELRAALKVVSGALLPIVAVALGAQLRFTLPRHHRAATAVAIVGKLIALPLLAYGFASVLGLRGEMRAAAVYQSAMPTMMSVGALLSMAGLAPDLAAAIIGYTTLFSVVTLPAWHFLLQHGGS